jgi:hypothetical protein
MEKELTSCGRVREMERGQEDGRWETDSLITCDMFVGGMVRHRKVESEETAQGNLQTRSEE